MLFYYSYSLLCFNLEYRFTVGCLLALVSDYVIESKTKKKRRQEWVLLSFFWLFEEIFCSPFHHY